jgi:GDP-L-fucose synthase
MDYTENKQNKIISTLLSNENTLEASEASASNAHFRNIIEKNIKLFDKENIYDQVLVFGGTGLIGTALKKIKPKWKYLSSHDGDLRYYENCEKIFKKYKYSKVIFLAANVGGLYKNLDHNYTMFHDNIRMAMNVIHCCNLYNIKDAIFCLSTCIFPDSSANIKINELIHENNIHDGEPHHSNYGYAHSKRLIDVMCNLSNETFNSKFCCIIPTNIYGENDNFDLQDSHVIPALIHRAYIASQAKSHFIVKGTGKALRQFLYVDDVADIIAKLLENPIRPHKIIIAPDEEISIKDLVLLIADEFCISHNNILYDYNKNDGQYKKTCSNELFKSYYSKFQFTELKYGIKHTCDWFKKNYPNIRK